MTRGRLRYEPALDGLRGIAVLAVMLYHGQVSWTVGGFLGVDLFFVLSGYLITGLLLAEHARSGTISLARFWGRRARRLLPALFLVLLAVCLYAGFLARAAQRHSLRLDALSTLGYVANWRLALTHQSYFAQYADPSPLRHMWSLGIEEQYYLLFPLVLLVWLRMTSGRTRSLRVALLAGVAGSALLMWALFDPVKDPSRVYYGTDTRAQALLIGALLGAWCADHPVRYASRTYLQVGSAEVPVPGWGAIGVLALGGFFVLVAVVHDLSPWLYRGGLSLAAVIGAALVAGATRARPGHMLRRALSWWPLRAIGVISYGLYLWHWPIYVVANPERTGLTSLPLLTFRFVLTFTAAALSYRLIERPIRRGSGLPGLRRLRPWVATVGTAAVVAGAVVASTAGAVAFLPARVAAGEAVQPSPNAVRVFIIGDSVAYGLWREFRQETARDVVVGGSYQLGCGLMAIPTVVDGQTDLLEPGCRAFDSRWPGEAAAFEPSVAVLMLGIGEQFDRRVDGKLVRFGTPGYERFLDAELDRRVAVLGSGGRPVALMTVPCHRVLESGVSPIPAIVNDDRRIRWLNDVQRRYASGHADQVRLIDLHGFLCANGYTDQLDGVQRIWRWLAPQLTQIARGEPGG